jgi:hypothetical protein
MNTLSNQITKEAGRKLLMDALRDELLGPEGGESEILRQRPSLRYLLGRLAPAGTRIGQEDDEGLGDVAGDSDEDHDAGSDGPISMAMNPSSIGVSFVVDEVTSEIEVEFTWGDYFQTEIAHHEPTVKSNEPLDETDEAKKNGASEDEVIEDLNEPGGVGYQRQARSTGPIRLHIKNSDSVKQKVETQEGEDTGVLLWSIIKTLNNGRRAVSLFMLNTRPAPPEDSQIPEESWIFQPKIAVRAIDGEAVFCAREVEYETSIMDPEIVSQEMLYWDRPEFAVGHGCAASWNQVLGERRATEVATDVLPAWELPRIDPRSDVEAELRMAELGGASADGVPGQVLFTMLSPLADAYEDWIKNVLRVRLLDPDFPQELRETALDHIESCEESLRRIREGIELVSSGPDEVRRAFCFANRAMALQRERSLISLAKRRQQNLPTIDPPTWRPFQIAFILVTISSLVNREHADRSSTDLLWFPTGGGKTEAYLGLTAFTLAHRRLRTPLDGYRNDAGVTVLMRYTLRLLTIQQFQRATTLICACEHLRITENEAVGEPYWGKTPFSIGLWVGRSATPNQYSSTFGGDGAKEVIEKLSQRDPGENPLRGVGTPLQLLACPWCGSDLTVDNQQQDYIADDAREMVHVFCSSNECFFSRVNGPGIPAHTVDTQLYRRVPSLVISTVDKFAQMPFNGRVQSLFGKVSKECPRHGFLSDGEGSSHTANSHAETPSMPKATVVPTLPLEPPDLVIQDELHLISGPLGTMVGAYETAVNYLTSVRLGDNLVGPKIIASTATIRRADRQVGALFNKKLAVFPPLGLQSTDSWFGQEIPVTESPGRMYLGVYAPGRSVKTALVRVYATLLSRAKSILDANEKSGDPYMTLVGYYNSLRELGGAIRLLEDDVPARITVLSRRDKDKWPRRYINKTDQLTSNKKAEEVPEILRQLEFEFSSQPVDPKRRPIDVLLASNMISVGVDIDRLAVMVVTGQPKTTAEYIQATSRVGRQSPGLVVCVYNWSRPRDTSHFERFRSYHGSLYRFVEATSVTPFSSRARDKALQGILSAMVRLGDPAMTPESHADQLNRYGAQVAEVVDQISSRSSSVANYCGEIPHVVKAATHSETQNNLDEWESSYLHEKKISWTKHGLGVVKKNQQPDPNKGFLLESQEDRDKRADGVGGVFVAPGSLREVETEIPVFLVRKGSAATNAAGTVTEGDSE